MIRDRDSAVLARGRVRAHLGLWAAGGPGASWSGHGGVYFVACCVWPFVVNFEYYVCVQLMRKLCVKRDIPQNIKGMIDV